MMMQIRRGVLPMIGAEECGVQNGKKSDDVYVKDP